MTTLISVLLRLLLLVVGLASAAVIALGALVVLALWATRAAWARLTGRPTTPFIFRFNPRQGFDQMYRRASEASRTPRADSVPTARKIADVTDVEPKTR